MPSLVCKHNKFSHWKFGKFCNFLHIDEKCQDNQCDAKRCDLRHPKMCIFIFQKKSCKFDEVCSFTHCLDTAASDMEGNLEQIRLLKDLIEKKDIEI